MMSVNTGQSILSQISAKCDGTHFRGLFSKTQHFGKYKQSVVFREESSLSLSEFTVTKIICLADWLKVW